MAAAASLRQTRLTVLLSLNAVAVVIAGLLVASAIWFNGGMQFRMVSERSDVTDEDAAKSLLSEVQGTSISDSAGGVSNEPVAAGELWHEEKISIYQTADFDLCVGGGLKDLGEMYWQTSNSGVIAGFYATAREWLGYSSETCRYPIIKETGSTTVTAGTYDGTRRDSITVVVLPPPVQQWQREVLDLVNKERLTNGVRALTWGENCADAAQTRAKEAAEAYSHTRPNGSSWATSCPIPEEGGVSGENLAAGNAVASPELVVAAWLQSKEHKKNILNPAFTKLAVGFNYDVDAKYKIYWSQFFSTY